MQVYFFSVFGLFCNCLPVCWFIIMPHQLVQSAVLTALLHEVATCSQRRALLTNIETMLSLVPLSKPNIFTRVIDTPFTNKACSATFPHRMWVSSRYYQQKEPSNLLDRDNIFKRKCYLYVLQFQGSLFPRFLYWLNFLCRM